MANRIVRWILTGDNKSALRALVEVEHGAGRAGNSLERFGRSARRGLHEVESSSKKVHGAIGGLAATIGAGGLAFGIKDVVTSGMQWQTQQAQLQSSLRATGLRGLQLADALRRVSDASETSSTHGGFEAATEQAGIAKFITETHSATRALRLNAETVAVARHAGLDYASAQSIVARAQTGQARGLARYIGIVQPVTSHVNALTLAHQQQVAHLAHLTAAQRAANPQLVAQLIVARRLNPELLHHAQLLDRQATATKINALVMRELGGSTSAYSHTAAGALSNARNGFEAMKQQLGRSLLPAVTKVGIALAGVAQWMERHKTLTLAIIGVTATLAIGLGVLGLAITAVETATRAWTAIQAVLDAELWMNPIGMIVLAIAGLVAAVVACYLHFRAFRTVVNAVFNWLKGAVRTVVGFFKQHWEMLGLILGGPFMALGLLVAKHFGTVKRIIGDVVDWVAAKFDWLWHKIKGVIDAVINLPGHAVHAVGSFASGALHTASFGLFNQGGLVRHFAPGGFVTGPGGIDQVPARLTAGEFVLRKEVVNAVGVGNLNSLNSTGRIAADASGEYVTSPVIFKVGERVLAEAVVRHQLQKAARA